MIATASARSGEGQRLGNLADGEDNGRSDGHQHGMEENIAQSGPIEFDAQDDYLMSEHAPDDCMGLSDLDGFLTGIAVGPELIQPSEWLPVIWGGAEPEFSTEDEMRAVLTAIMGRYNEIVTCFEFAPNEFEPIFWEGPAGEVIASDWASGLLDAVVMRSSAWDPLLDDSRAELLMMPLLILGSVARTDAGADPSSWPRYPPSSQPALRLCTNSGATTVAIKNHHQAGVDAGSEAADAVDLDDDIATAGSAPGWSGLRSR